MVIAMKYKVNVTRIGYANLDIEVEASSSQSAKQIALDVAGNHFFSEHMSDYKVQSVQEEKPKKKSFKKGKR